MKESTTYQKILNEGREVGREEGRVEGREEGQLAEARRFALRLGTRCLGEPNPAVVDAINNSTDTARLEVLVERLLQVESWSALLKDSEGDGA